MFWIRGGGFQIGNNWLLDPSFLVLKDLIVVTINYRLGVFGFSSTGDDSLPGNYEFWDMIEALKWVNKNLESFGGDPGMVTIFGEAAERLAISSLSLIPSNRGLFHRAIMQTGVAVGEFFNIRDPFRVTARIGTHVGCITDSDLTIDKEKLVACLKEKPTMDFDEITLSALLWPNVDGELIVRRPYENDPTSEASIFFRSLDVIAGTTDNEATLLPYILMKVQYIRN